MSPHIPKHVPVAKGMILYCLDEISKGRGARARIAKLRKAIADLGPSYAGLAEVFDKHLVSAVIRSPAVRRRTLDHLNTYWFDPASPRAYFPGTPVSRIYAEGVLRALDLSLKGKGRTVPINAWWLLDSNHVAVLAVADVQGGVTVGSSVSLIVHTPRPKGRHRASAPWILGHKAEAHVTRRERRAVVTRRVRDM
jgi:hypothetical protein